MTQGTFVNVVNDGFDPNGLCRTQLPFPDGANTRGRVVLKVALSFDSRRPVVVCSLESPCPVVRHKIEGDIVIGLTSQTHQQLTTGTIFR